VHPETPQLSRTRHIPLIVMAALAIASLCAPAAFAANYHDAIRDCNDDGVLQGTYTRGQLRQARNHLPSSLREYSDCSEVLARALAAAGRKGSGGVGGGDSGPPAGDPKLTTPSGAVASNNGALDALKKRAALSTKDQAPEQVTVGGRQITPGTGGLSSSAVRTSPNDLPLPLLLALAALAAAGVLAGLLLMRHRWPETRRVALRLLRR
jgi:hypothetical protein